MRQSDPSRILSCAELFDREADTWCDGFAVQVGTKEKPDWIWRDPESDFAHVRVIKLRSASEFLRDLAKRHPVAIDFQI